VALPLPPCLSDSECRTVTHTPCPQLIHSLPSPNTYTARFTQRSTESKPRFACPYTYITCLVSSYPGLPPAGTRKLHTTYPYICMCSTRTHIAQLEPHAHAHARLAAPAALAPPAPPPPPGGLPLPPEGRHLPPLEKA